MTDNSMPNVIYYKDGYGLVKKGTADCEPYYSLAKLSTYKERLEGMERKESDFRYGYEMGCDVLYNQAIDDALELLTELFGEV